jgi:hypothetical protein
VTSFAASATGAGITLVGEIVDLDSRNGSDLSSMSVRWLGVTVGPTGAFRTVRSDAGPAGDHARAGAPAADAAGHPTNATPDDAGHHGAAPDNVAGDGAAAGWGSGAFLASAMRAADGGGASFIPPQRSGDDPRRSDRPDQDRRPGRRGLTGSIRRLIDGPQGRHRRTHH